MPWRRSHGLLRERPLPYRELRVFGRHAESGCRFTHVHWNVAHQERWNATGCEDLSRWQSVLRCRHDVRRGVDDRWRPLREDWFIPTGRGAHSLYASRDSKALYVSNRGEGSVSVIDFATRKVIKKWE